MRVRRVYQPGKYSADDIIELSPQAAKHIALVLRMRVGNSLHVFNGQGQEFTATIITIKKSTVRVCIEQELTPLAESSISISLGQCISRGDRMDYAIQKACELGVTSITPLISERCQLKLTPKRLQKRMEHWQGIMIGAVEQCGRATLPSLYQPEALLYWAKKEPSKTWLCAPTHGTTMTAAAPKQARLIIGPEGGLSENEIQGSIHIGCSTLSLGPRILRTETATVVALSLMQYQWGDLDHQ